MSKIDLPNFFLSNNREIDLDMLMVAIEDNTCEIHWFFNSITGEVESYSEDYLSCEQFEKDMEEIENNNYIYPISKLESWKPYKFMVDFNKEVVKQRNELMYEKLLVALDGDGAFRRFNDILHDDAELLNQWYFYKNEKLIREAKEWLEFLNIKFKITK